MNTVDCAHLDHAKALNTTLIRATKQLNGGTLQSIVPSENMNSTSTAPPVMMSLSANPAFRCKAAKSQQSVTDTLRVKEEELDSILSFFQTEPSTLRTVRNELTADMATATTTVIELTTIVSMVTETAGNAPTPTIVVEDTGITALPSGTTLSVDATTTTLTSETERISLSVDTGDADSTSMSSTATSETITSATTSLLFSISDQTTTETSHSFISTITAMISSATARSSTSSSPFTTPTAAVIGPTPSGIARPSQRVPNLVVILTSTFGSLAIFIIVALCAFFKVRDRKRRKNGTGTADLPIHLQPIPHNPYRVEPTLPSVEARGSDYPYIGARRTPVLPDRGPDYPYIGARKDLSATNSNASSNRPPNAGSSPADSNSHHEPRASLLPSDSASQISQPVSAIRPSVYIVPSMPTVPERRKLRDHNNPYRVGVHELDGEDKVLRMGSAASKDKRRRSAVSALSTLPPRTMPRESYFATDTVLSDDPFRSGRG